MPLKKSRWFVSAVCISLLAAGGAARAEDKSSIEPSAERILKAAIGHLAAAKSYMVRGELSNEIQLPGGQRIEYSSTLQAAVRRPDRVWTRVEGQDAPGEQLVRREDLHPPRDRRQRVRVVAGAADHRRAAGQDEGEARLPAPARRPDAPDTSRRRPSRTSRAASTSGRPWCAAARAATWPSRRRTSTGRSGSTSGPRDQAHRHHLQEAAGGPAVRRHLHRLGFQRARSRILSSRSNRRRVRPGSSSRS